MLSGIGLGISNESSFWGVLFGFSYDKPVTKAAPKALIDNVFFAIREVNLEKVQVLMNQAQSMGYSLDTHDSRTQVTPLHYAVLKCRMNNVEQMMPILEILHKHGVNLNTKSLDSFAHTPLHSATRRALPPVVNYLLKNGANSRAQDGHGKTPLDYISQIIYSREEANQAYDNQYERFKLIEQALTKPHQSIKYR